MKKQCLLFLGCILQPMLSYGMPDVIPFDAQRDCQARQTSAGIRYVPPCQFTPQSVTPEQHKVLLPDSELTQGLFKSTVYYYFSCESLRPLSILYTMNEGDIASIIGTIAGTVPQRNLTNSLSHSYDSASFNVESLDGAVEIQAIKPGCQMRIESFISYPQPEYFRLMTDSQINVDKLLQTIFSSAQPDMNYVSALGVIDNAQLLLSFLRAQSDPLTQGMIDLTVTNLIGAKETLAQQCEADSTTLLCSQAIANTRATLADEIRANEQRLIELRDYIQSQVTWLLTRDQDIDSEIAKLQYCVNALEQQLTP